MSNRTHVLVDKAKWFLVFILIGGGIVANSYDGTLEGPMRWVVGLLVAGIAAGIALWTQSGQHFVKFAKETKMELERVVWPTRQETVKTTMLVGIIVVVMAFLLWIIDTLLAWMLTWWGNG